MNKIRFLIIVMTSLMTTPSFATLGKPITTMQGDITVKNYPSYKIASYEKTPKINIREYTANGTVFAVSWDGPLKPNLAQLLGAHYATLTNELAKRSYRGRTPIYIKQADIVIEVEGHPRSFFGRAYLPDMMPTGMLESEIK